MYTRGGAYMSFDEKEKDKLPPDIWQILAVLSKDIFKTDPEEIADISVELTIMGGKICYEKDHSAPLLCS